MLQKLGAKGNANHYYIPESGYIVFGIDNDRYIAYDVAYNQVLSMLSGKFDYSEMADTNPWLAPLYYLTV